MTRKVVGPFNRVEGDLEVRLDIEAGQVRDAWVVSSLYRGFERILHGKPPMDALGYVPRICGICSAAQSVAAAQALADAQEIQSPENGELAVNLILATENMADHLTHFYLFFMPDFARDAYADRSWHAEVAQRFRATVGEAAQQMLPARARLMHIMGLLAGKWPHTMSIQPGGTSRAVRDSEKLRLQSMLYDFRRFLERYLFGDRLEHLAALASRSELARWREHASHARSDFGCFLELADDLALEKLGRATDIFMSYGAYRIGDAYLLPRGVWRNGCVEALDTARIAEDVSHAWMGGGTKPRHPWDGVTMPDMEAEHGYTWCKAPRLDGEVVEVGALARLLVAQHPLIASLVSESGGNVRNRVIARLVELAIVTMAMEDWVRRLSDTDPYCIVGTMPEEADGMGLIEAARGSLGHWVRIKRGRILNYQIIAPTTWNFSPRDAQRQRGPVEQALLGAPVTESEPSPLAVQHIVRSFDPCMVCTVH